MPPKKKQVNLPSTPPPVRYTSTPEREREFLKANELYIIAGAQANSLRNSVQVALIAQGLESTPEMIAYVSKKMVERNGASLLDEIEGLKGLAKRLLQK